MSALLKLDIKFHDADSVVAALTEAGFLQVKRHDAGKEMWDYDVHLRGNTNKTIAHVIAPKNPNDLLSDIGFVRGDDGLRFVISDTDQWRFQRAVGGENWDDAVGRFTQLYGKHYVQSHSEGYEVESEKIGDEIHMTLSRYV
jgi:hypothetical protein